ncbi:hypothetical protein HY418_00910 [Candidatus Kaiserbacteria bacterium]|nr:hypothetical protein [Candidatus Kaiserbacteria bacterium]
MGDIIRRLVWFTVVATAVAYATLLVGGSFISARAASLNSAITVRDELAPGSHHLMGMVMVPASCYELSVRTESVSGNAYQLVFNTWRDPAVPCSPDEVARAFHAVLYAPATGVEITATMDGKGLPIAVLPVVPER